MFAEHVPKYDISATGGEHANWTLKTVKILIEA